LGILKGVWFPYTASDPEYPPRWCDFELWYGDVLFVNSSDEPTTDEVVRVWYTRPRTLNGLDGASTTTLPADHETLIVVGATGYVAQERVQEQPGWSVPVRLREWADARLKEFERGLKMVARQQAARHSGIAPLAQIDRWDKGDDEW
jgi:hypothetical protein